MQTTVSRGRSATKGLQSFNRLETVYDNGKPVDITTTVVLFITDEAWHELGEPNELTVTLDPTP